MPGQQLSALFSSVGTEDDVIITVLDRQNNWTKSVHTLAWCKRFHTNVQLRVNNQHLAQGPVRTRRTRGNHPRNPTAEILNYEELHLNPKEVVATEELLFSYAQRSALATEIDLLSSGQEVQKNSSIKNLIPIWDEENQLLKHNSRIINYNPIILPYCYKTFCSGCTQKVWTQWTEFDTLQGKKEGLDYIGKTTSQESSLQMQLSKNYSSK